MIAELFTYLITPCAPAARKLGYLKELIAIDARHKRNQSQWKPHIDSTREAILSTAATCRERKLAVVFGAGLLLDIPIEDLSSQFERVVLMDVVVLRKTRRKIDHFANVEWRFADVTGIMGKLLETDWGDELPKPTVASHLVDGADLVVSANILSQLSILPESWIRRHSSTTERTLHAWSQSLIKQHLVLLRTSSGKTCLITDMHRNWVSRSGSTDESESILEGNPLPASDSEWIWKVAPVGELSRSHGLNTRVGVFRQV